MVIEYDHDLHVYRMGEATANTRMMLVKLACGTVDEETHEDEFDEPEDEPEYE